MYFTWRSCCLFPQLCCFCQTLWDNIYIKTLLVASQENFLSFTQPAFSVSLLTFSYGYDMVIDQSGVLALTISLLSSYSPHRCLRISVIVINKSFYFLITSSILRVVPRRSASGSLCCVLTSSDKFMGRTGLP